MMRRGVILLLLLAGCSSESTAPADLAAGPSSCMYGLGGALSGSLVCEQRFCRQPTGDGLRLFGPTPNALNSDFTPDGQLTFGKSYGGADLKTWDAGYRELSSATVSYVAGNSVANSTVSITITGFEPNADTQCGPSGNGTAHGSAHIGLVESVRDVDAGVWSPGSGRATIDVTF
jgi:hypothetical protein